MTFVVKVDQPYFNPNQDPDKMHIWYNLLNR